MFEPVCEIECPYCDNGFLCSICDGDARIVVGELDGEIGIASSEGVNAHISIDEPARVSELLGKDDEIDNLVIAMAFQWICWSWQQYAADYKVAA